jgi:predicted MFS family arabinose efflux permease
MDDQRGRVAVRACSAFALLSGALVVTASAPNIVLLGAVLVVVGVPIAPLNAIGAQRLQDNLERRQLGEGFALFSALILIGVGLGNYATAQLLDVLGPSGLLLCAGALMGVAAVLLAPAARAQWASTDRPAHV